MLKGKLPKQKHKLMIKECVLFGRHFDTSTLYMLTSQQCVNKHITSS